MSLIGKEKTGVLPPSYLGQVGRHGEKATANRERMPGTAAEVDAWRAVFGPRVKVLHAIENGIEVGTRQEQRTMSADQWLHYLKTGVMP